MPKCPKCGSDVDDDSAIQMNFYDFIISIIIRITVELGLMYEFKCKNCGHTWSESYME